MRIGIIGQWESPLAANLRRVDLMVTGSLGAPTRWYGSPCVCAPMAGYEAWVVSHVTVVAAATPEALAQGLKGAITPVVVGIGPAGSKLASVALGAAAKLVANGKAVALVELVAETCIELRIDGREVIGVPADGVVESLLPDAPSTAPHVPTPLPEPVPAEPEPVPVELEAIAPRAPKKKTKRLKESTDAKE